jgi:flagellar export protein FliJ
MMMSGFTFRLQRILGLREHREREMALALAAAQRAAAEAHEVHDALTNACADGHAELARTAADAGGPTAGELHNLALVLEHLQAQASAAGDACTAAEAQVDQSANALAAAAQARHVLEQLREQQRTAWQEEEQHAEQRDMDAVALNQYVARIARVVGE